MIAYQQRVCDEKSQLDDKIQKLKKFLGEANQNWMMLPLDEKLRLRRQCKIMELYQDVLCERIAAFSEGAK